MAVQAMWVQGHSATIELNRRGRGGGEDIGGVPWTAIEGLRVGWGVVYRGQDNSDYWFHFAIPTPMIDEGVRARLRRVMARFTADRIGPEKTLRKRWQKQARVAINQFANAVLRTALLAHPQRSAGEPRLSPF